MSALRLLRPEYLKEFIFLILLVERAKYELCQGSNKKEDTQTTKFKLETKIL